MKNNYPMEEILELLSERVSKYTSNESSSVTYDTARQLMSSMLYCIEAADYDSSKKDDTALPVSKQINARKAFEIGLLKRKEKVVKAKLLYQKISNSFYFYQNRCYYDTIIKGMPIFFDRYDPEFNADNHILSLDYPLLYPIINYTGIDLIAEYLQRTLLEQNFLHKFSYSAVMNILNEYHPDHCELIVNICKLIFRNAIGCILLDKPIRDIVISNDEIIALKVKTKDKTLHELENILACALTQMIKSDFPSESALYNYLKQDISEFSIDLKNCLDHDSLEKLFIGNSHKQDFAEETFIDGLAMEDEALRNLISKMRGLNSMPDKLALIKNEVKSLSDLTELLRECFYADEYEAVFALLSTAERKILIDNTNLKSEFVTRLEDWEYALLHY
jgi:hypothetical protein